MPQPSPEAIVREFFAQVRSGRNPDLALGLMAPVVLAHQVNAEAPVTVERTPQNYADHVREMLATFGQFELEISECLAQGDRVYVRWRQTGRHLAHYDGFAPTGLPVIEVASAVYRVEQGRIAEYWIQIDRAGIRAQLERAAARAGGAAL